jgi:hypothetical protein
MADRRRAFKPAGSGEGRGRRSVPSAIGQKQAQPAVRHADQGQEQQRARDVEQDMGVGDLLADIARRGPPERGDAVHQKKPDRDRDDVEPEVNSPILTAARERPSVATSVSAQVPISAPSMMATPAGRSISPAPASAMTMPMVAEEDWIAAVTAAPASAPISG